MVDATTTCGVCLLLLLPVIRGALVAAETSSAQQQQQAVVSRARHPNDAANRSTSVGDVTRTPSKDQIGSPSSSLSQQQQQQQQLLPRRNIIRGERETAVITRLPHMKTEVCRAERLEQTISVRGCVQRSVVNRYCYGQCNSFFIPRSAKSSGRSSSKSEPEGPASRRRHRSGSARSLIADGSTSFSSDDAMDAEDPLRPARPLNWSAFRSCSFCRPKRVEWVTVVLSCPKRRPSYRRRRVQIVKECACTALTLD